MLTVVTGAFGFVGTALARRMAEARYPGRVLLVDRKPAKATHGFECLAADLTDSSTLAEILDGADRVVHLAALPGGAAERDPELSRRINLTLPLEMLELLARRATPARFVHASSIAVLGDLLPDPVGDETAGWPTLTYGAHKRMAEIAVQDAARRGTIDAISLRLPGIVARPRDANGFKSAFMSDVFWALAAGEPFVVPVGPEATMWLMSARRCADNLLHALTCPLPEWRLGAITLPVVRARMDGLVATIADAVDLDPSLVSYAPDPLLEAQFGRLPRLDARTAVDCGFRSDGGLADLVRAALEDGPGLAAGIPGGRPMSTAETRMSE